MNHLGIVAIGRNEGERLRRCLASVVGHDLPVVYVDSGSTDGSVELARRMGAVVVELDMSRPFTMARGRNAGFEELEKLDPDVRFVQFVDGDCEIVAGWLERACAVIESRPDVAAVAGQRRERFPNQSIYNRLADIEWNAPAGEAKYCSGDVLVRADAFRQVKGYNVALIAGEDPDLGIRFRQKRWLILRIDAQMTLHDMAMTRFSQWWRRSTRSGYAYAEGAAMYGKPPERHWVREIRRIMLWGIVIPCIILGLAWPTRGISFLLCLAYPLQAAWIARRQGKAGLLPRDAWLYGAACVVGRFPNTVGAVRYWYGRLTGRRQALIDYKGSAEAAVTLNPNA
jgi:glycosyltransferase involved in cell wall biosynthesis